MKIPSLLVTFGLLLLAVAPVRATDSYQYARDEYAIISDGLAPNKRLSLASHGEGEDGDTNFHVWLMAEPRPTAKFCRAITTASSISGR